jgi:hypothetical protein
MHPSAGVGSTQPSRPKDNAIIVESLEAGMELSADDRFEIAWFAQHEEDELKGYLVDDVCFTVSEY